jgi:signal transduction histidine kinase
MARLVDDLLDMARLERSRLPLDWRVTSLRELLRRVLEPLEARARSRGLAFRVAVATDVPRRIRTDPVRFGQVLSNVVDNAIKFTAEGTIEVDVRRGDDGRALVAQVSDTGVGISAEWHATIFEPFAQATPGQRSGHGVGLGLAIAAELVRSMGGRIEVQSAPGCGSTFRVTLPLEEMAE